MTIYEKWQGYIAAEGLSQEQQQLLWNQYYTCESGVYEKLLGEKRNRLEGTYASLAEEFELEEPLMMGFLDGVNTSLEEAIDLEGIHEDTPLDITIDWEKLYFNMHKAKAPWLYGLEQWDNVLDAGRRRQIARDYRLSVQAFSGKVAGRNDPCPCGSGKKYKKCCGRSA
ncbi:MAG: SEC-C metal-binding domain-containing protein [Christensenellales bacterium]|jgi:hypothetical protein